MGLGCPAALTAGEAVSGWGQQASPVPHRAHSGMGWGATVAQLCRVAPCRLWQSGPTGLPGCWRPALPRPLAVPLGPRAAPLAICMPSQHLLIPGRDRGQLTGLLFP